MDIASVLKSEITRLAKKALKGELTSLRQQSAAQRKQLSALRQQVAEIERRLGAQQRDANRAVASKAKCETAESRSRYSQRSLLSQRARLGLSQAEFGALLGVSGQSVFNYEHNADLRPKPAVIEALAWIRMIGRKEARSRLTGKQ